MQVTVYIRERNGGEFCKERQKPLVGVRGG